MILCNIVPTQVDKNARKLADINNCAVSFLSRAAANLCGYYYVSYSVIVIT